MYRPRAPDYSPPRPDPDALDRHPEGYQQRPPRSSSQHHHRSSEPPHRSPEAVLVRGSHFPAGQFASQNLRPGLLELQRPLLGRKYAVKDRRPVDPPPIVKLQAFRTVATRGWDEEKLVQDYSDFHELGLICHVDLFPVPFMSDARTVPHTSDDDPDIIARVDDFLIRESSKRTASLAGETFVQAAKLEHKGNIVLFFIFPDISVRTEGVFILRYQCFDLQLFSTQRSPTEGLPILAETYGSTFEVFSTKDFPGLKESTELTKHVAKYNIRVNVRETRRTRNRGQETESEGRDSN